MTEAADAVIATIATKLPPDRPAPAMDDRLDELGLESLDVVDMIFELEDRFGIEIPVNANNSEREFRTVADVVREVERLVAAKGGA